LSGWCDLIQVGYGRDCLLSIFVLIMAYLLIGIRKNKEYVKNSPPDLPSNGQRNTKSNIESVVIIHNCLSYITVYWAGYLLSSECGWLI